MTTRPELRDTGGLAPALAAVALFVLMAVVFLGAPIGDAAGFPNNAEVANESLGDASVASNASVAEQNGSTIALVQAASGNQSTTLANTTGVNATIKTAGGQTYATVSESVSITATIGYAMMGLNDQIPADLESESFLAVFEIIDLVLVAALVGAVTLARREGAGTVVALFTSTEDGAPGGAVAADGGSEASEDVDEPATSGSSEGGDA